MPETARYVVDASTVVKWHLDDEQYGQEAMEVLADYREGRVALLAPENLRYEVPGALRTAVVRGRLSREDGRLAVESFLDLDLPTVRASSLTLLGYDYAFRYGCSFYDALYLALADVASCPLLFADHRLRSSLQSRFPHALWLADYRSPGSGTAGDQADR